MTHALGLTDGTTTLNLNDGTATLLTAYPMQAPEINRRAVGGNEDGPLLASPAWSNVTETITLLIMGANPAAARATLATLEALLDRARQNAYGWGRARCYLTAQLAGEADAWRTEILAGKVTPLDPMGDVWKNKIEVELIITRRHYWEGPRTALHLSSQATSETTSPVTWHNGGDGFSGERNWINVAANRVAGNLPAPPELHLKLTGSTQTIGSIYIGNTVWMDPANLDPIMLGSEAASPGASKSWTGAGWTTAFSWRLATATLDRIRGQMIRPLVAYSTSPALLTLQQGELLVSDLGSNVWVNDVFVRNNSIGDSVLDYGPMPLPPGGDAATGLNTLDLRIRMNRTGGGTESVTAHSLHLMPSGEGVFRHIAQVGPSFDLATNDVIVDDPLERLTYAHAGGARYPVFRGYHSPVYLWPGRQNRLRVLVAAAPWAARIAWTAQAWYRPRRLTI